MKIAFFVWNPFQVYQFESIVGHIPDATYVLERRKTVDVERLFSDEFRASMNAPVLEVARSEIPSLDGRFDAILCQTAFAHMERFDRTKVIGMQYSMSKERHQYGPWRTLCDLNLVYGQYSADRIAPYSPVVQVGNPRFDRWFAGAFDEAKLLGVRARLDPTKKTILYLPTWGDLSSMTDFGAAVAELRQHYNVIAKVHHKTDSHEVSRKATLTESGVQEIFGAADDLLYLLRESDLVLSDYSGAIFDAINVGKPVILLQRRPEELAAMGAEKFGLESIEYLRRDMIGPVVTEPERLAAVVDELLSGGSDYREPNRVLKRECFAREADSGQFAAQAIADFLAAPVARPYHQIYVRDMLREHRIEEEERKLAQRKQARSLSSRSRKALALALPAVGVKTTKGPDWRTRLFRAALVIPRTLAKPLRALVERRLVAAVEAARDAHRPFEPTTRLNRMARILRARRLGELATMYDSQETSTAAVWLARALARRSESAGLTLYTRLLAKYEQRDELLAIVDSMLAKPVGERVRFLQRAARANDFCGGRTAELAAARQQTHEFLLARLPDSKNKRRNSRWLHALVANRWLDDAQRIAATVPLTPFARKNHAAAPERTRELMQDYYVLCEMANHNHRPNVTAGDHLCLVDGQPSKVAESGSRQIVEFLLPPYFFSASETEAATRQRICAMLRAVLDELTRLGVAIVPRHQFRLDCVQPTGWWPLAFSYHTNGSRPGHWHIKDAPLAGYFSIDSTGYSGWAAIAGLDDLPDVARLAAAGEVDAAWDELRERYVVGNVSKYAQGQAEFVSPAGPYVFLPMQTVGDVVAKLAWIPTLALAHLMAEWASRGDGPELVIKRHPKCTSAEVAAFVHRYAGAPRVHFTEASIHDVLPGASAVVTVNSGVGLEALMHGKTVITTGAAEYSVVTRKARSATELSEQLARISEPADLDRIKRFVYYYLRHYLVAGDQRAAVSAKLAGILAGAANI